MGQVRGPHVVGAVTRASFCYCGILRANRGLGYAVPFGASRGIGSLVTLDLRDSVSGLCHLLLLSFLWILFIIWLFPLMSNLVFD